MTALPSVPRCAARSWPWGACELACFGHRSRPAGIVSGGVTDDVGQINAAAMELYLDAINAWAMDGWGQTQKAALASRPAARTTLTTALLSQPRGASWS